MSLVQATDANLAKDVISAFGGLSATGRALGGCPVSTIHAWVKTGRIPAWRKRDLIEAARSAGVVLPLAFCDDATAGNGHAATERGIGGTG